MERRLQFNVRAAADAQDSMEFTGIGVPYNEIIELWGESEQFAPGSVRMDGAPPILWQHHRDAPIGVIKSSRDTEAGFEITGQLSDTAAARDAWTLIKDGVIGKLSIGFEPVRTEIDMTGEKPLYTHTEVRVREFSLVTFPAYESAAITSHRAKETSMTDAAPSQAFATRGELEAINESLTDVSRRLALSEGAAPAPAPDIRSMGHYLKLLARGDETALSVYESLHKRFDAATGSTVLADSVSTPGPIRDFIRLTQRKRRMVNLFGTAPLPDTGMSVDYVKVGTDTTQVAKQAAEGDDLLKGKITLTPASAPLDTYGGWVELSRQVIERASVNHLDITLRALGMKYASATEAAFSSAVAGAISARGAGSGLALPAAPTWKDWLSLVVDAAELYDDGIYSMTGLLVSSETFTALATLETGNGAPLMNVFGPGTNQVGSIDLGGLSGNLGQAVPVSVLSGQTGSFAAFYDSEAARWCESPGAPAQLQDQNIVNLSNSFSVYGYGGPLVGFPESIEPVTFAS